ncbi:BMC domain-containing protein [Romboutsia sp. CE17]|uniref:BMC domain-containing protein n=1 Tax=Romboutsia sp. CE17 TaxID=2724150 RepID=UPI001442E290|nr:BMC domain-containing protein [Romboutsia sp. CE17]QJA08823.1 BMC domain-containing protein [Romboutsia sp. CE17]
MLEEKQRLIQESVPGKQVTIAHIIANPREELYQKVGLAVKNRGSIGILNITPGETAIIAANIAIEYSKVSLAFVDRFSGSLVITGDLTSVESAINQILVTLKNTLNFFVTSITKS